MSLDTAGIHSTTPIAPFGDAGAIAMPPATPTPGRLNTAHVVDAVPSLVAWDESELEQEEDWFGDESAAFIGSLIIHLSLLVLLGLTPLLQNQDREAVVLVASRAPDEVEQPLVVDQVSYSEATQSEVGANSMADTAMAEASAEMFAEMAEIPSPVEIEPDRHGDRFVNNLFSQPVAPLDKLKNQKGKVGEGTQGAAGAVDRLTFEILQSLEERPTLVVWLFDQSGSLHRQRGEIRDRFDHIYEELGIVEHSGGKAFRRHAADMPLATSIIGFGKDVQLYTEQPIDDLKEIKSIVDSIPMDTSGIERVFTAVELAADRFKSLRRNRGESGPQRNVILIVVTDERGDDTDRIEPAIEACRRWGMPVYVIGAPAPFGREQTLVKYVDPDPKYDQTPQWAQVDQGPESVYPELVRVGFSGDFQEEPVVDSGFGPYGLTRLCYETGGIFFTVHPNRNVNREVRRGEIEPFASDLRYFFDPVAMSRYRPEYVTRADYEKLVKQSPLRTALVTAAMQVAPMMQRPQMRFVKRNEAGLVGDLTVAQRDAARLEPALAKLAATLEPGLAVRESETVPRWQAGYDVSMGRVLAQKVRTETYNAMLAKAKRGMMFEESKNNTWVLQPADEISVGSKWEREAALAKELLETVVDRHPGTPWALLAKKELQSPMGWRWREEFTDLAPQRPGTPGNNNPPRPPRDDEKRMLDKAPKRPVPKL